MEACEQACSWSPSIQLGVNCTIHQLRRGEVSSGGGRALEQTGFRSGQLTVEVTEDAIVDPAAAADLKELSQMGVQLSVDDAGTNWSSFEPFKRHSISTVKIDGSFIAGLESTQGINRLVVETVIHMAHSLGMSAIVEAVETANQVEIVRSFNADAAQGFFFARPMSGEHAASLAGGTEVPQFSRTEIRTFLRPNASADGAATPSPRRGVRCPESGTEVGASRRASTGRDAPATTGRAAAADRRGTGPRGLTVVAATDRSPGPPAAIPGSPFQPARRPSRRASRRADRFVVYLCP